MSLILEALRKSEAERRRGQTPDLHAELPPSPRARRTPLSSWAWWLPAAAALLLASVLVGKWLARGPAPAPSARPSAVSVAGSAAPGPDAAPTLPEIRRLSPTEAPGTQQETPASRVGAAPAPPTAAAPASQASVPQALPVSVPPPLAPAPARPTSEVIQLSDLGADERTSLPPLRISMHMWNDDPARRFVIIDGNRLGEGDRIGDAVVAAITPDGVLLDWNGRRIRLPIR